MSERLTALVLGVGGNVSQGILKALAAGSLDPRVVAACVSPLSAGLYGVDRAYVSPYADDDEFIGWLLGVCEHERVDVVLSGVEPVLVRLAADTELIRQRTGAVVIVSEPEKLEIGDDKLLTASWLAAHGFNAPASVDASDAAGVAALVQRLGYPLIAKPRRGNAARGVAEVRGDDELEHLRRQPGYLIQESLGCPDREYTVGCFSDRDGEVRGAMVIHRGLQEGTTVWARATEHPEVAAEATRIVAELRPRGPCNVQLRLADRGPVCFELNVRFSGTTPIRARLGFNDVEAAVRHYALGEPATDLAAVTEGVALRYWNELYVEPAAVAELERAGRLADPGAHHVVEDRGMGR